MKYETRVITEYAFICSRCGRRAPWGLSQEEARQLAEEDGWEFWRGEAICPNCQEGGHNADNA